MRKWFLIMLFAGFCVLIVGCNTDTKEITIQSCYCADKNGDCGFDGDEKEIKWECSKDLKLQVSSEVFSSMKNTNSLKKLDDTLKGIETNDGDIFNISSFLNKSSSLLKSHNGDYTVSGDEIITKNNCNIKNDKGKVYDVSLDLTYFDRKTASEGEINKYLMENRINKLESFFKGNNTQNLTLQPGDEVVLRFIGLLKHESVGTALNDEIHLKYNCEDTKILYNLTNEELKRNNMRGKLTYYYSLEEGSSSTTNDEGKNNTYNNLHDIMTRIEKEFYDRYGKNSEGTYLLDHLVNSMPSTYNDNYVRVILSDFLFQLSPSDISKIKSLYCSNGNSYCKDDFYQFNAENIAYKYNDKNSFKTFYTNYLFQQIPLLKKLCPIGSNGEKTKVYLLGINTVSGLSTQSNLKDYYSNYLFKDCTVYYK